MMLMLVLLDALEVMVQCIDVILLNHCVERFDMVVSFLWVIYKSDVRKNICSYL